MAEKEIKPRLRPIDWFAMIGMPILCALVLFFGLRAVIGPVPKASPVQKVKDGDIQTGMSVAKVLGILGRPKEIHTNPDGSSEFVYTRTVADPDLAIEAASIEFSEAGTVTSTRVERHAPSP